MVDIHCHVLFQADDGPDTFQECLDMLEQAFTQGITHVIATSHADKGKWHVRSEDVIEKVAMLSEYIADHQLPIEVSAGHEITISPHTATRVLNGELLTLANSQYVLIELPATMLPSYTWDVFQELLVAGYQPIIAHPERQQQIMDDPSILEGFVRGGVAAQLTSGALTGSYGKVTQKVAWNLIARQLIHTIASDAHDTTTRAFDLSTGIQLLMKYRYEDYAKLLLSNNQRILMDAPLEVLEPQLPMKKRWWSRR